MLISSWQVPLHCHATRGISTKEPTYGPCTSTESTAAGRGRSACDPGRAGRHLLFPCDMAAASSRVCAGRRRLCADATRPRRLVFPRACRDVDLQSRLDTVEPFASAGSGLQPTGLATLQTTTDAWADWLDSHGSWQGAGVLPPPTARFRRRWGILPFGPDGCLRLWVEVAPLDPAQRDRLAHAGSVRCPWGMGEP